MIQLPKALNIPVPPMLENVVGYEGDARYFALYWTPAGDEAMIFDGRMGGDGNWHGYQSFIDHLAVALPLASYRDYLGSSDEEASHWLVIDRTDRKAYVLPLNEASQFLAEQHPPLPQVEFKPEDWAEFLKRVQQTFAEIPSPTVEQVQARMNADYALEQEMIAWLTANTPAETKKQFNDMVQQLQQEG